jgi:hypothetical protein
LVISAHAAVGAVHIVGHCAALVRARAPVHIPGLRTPVLPLTILRVHGLRWHCLRRHGR